MALSETHPASNGSPAVAAAALFEKYGAFIRTAIRFQAKNEFQEDDLFQEFFLVLATKPIPANVSNVKSYIYRAVTNTVIEAARRQAREERCLKKHVEEIRISINKRTPQNAIIKQEEKESVFGCLARQLRRREAEAVMLRYRDDCSISEIAERMGVDRRTVSHYLSEGLRQLRRISAVE